MLAADAFRPRSARHAKPTDNAPVMLRILLTIILPVILPLALYIGYLAFARRRAQAAGAAGPRWEEGPWAWLVLAGVGLLIAILTVLRLSTGLPPDTKLEAPRLQDGQVVPSRVLDDDR